MPDIKWFLKSKTFWFNVLSLVVYVAGAFGFAGFSPDSKLAEYGAVLVTIINVILRFVTVQPVSLSKPITFGALKAGAPKKK
jgi:hypothetical protein